MFSKSLRLLLRNLLLSGLGHIYSAVQVASPAPLSQSLTLLLVGLAILAALLIACIVTAAAVLACRRRPQQPPPVDLELVRRRSRKPRREETELSEAGFNEEFHRRSAQYRASMYTQEIDRQSRMLGKTIHYSN